MQGPGHLRALPSPAPRAPASPYFWQVGQAHSGSMGRKSFSYCFFFSCRFPVGTKAEPKRWGGVGGEEGNVGHPGLHPRRPHPRLNPPGRTPPSAPCPGPHRRPRGEDAVEHVTSKSHADHQISGVAGGEGHGGGSREPHAPVAHPGLPPHRHADSPGTGPRSLGTAPRGRPGSPFSDPHSHSTNRGAQAGTRPPQAGLSPLGGTYPTPIRYRGLSLGSLDVLRATILQNWPLLSPPLRPPMAKPGTSLLVISGGTGQGERPPGRRESVSSSVTPGQALPRPPQSPRKRESVCLSVCLRAADDLSYVHVRPPPSILRRGPQPGLP